MSIFSKKKSPLEQIAIFKTAKELSVNKDLLKSKSLSILSNSSNSKDSFTYLIDLLTIVSGSESVNKVINNMISNVSVIDNSFKSKIKEEISSTLGGDKNQSPIPDNVKNGYKLHISKIDYNNDLFIPSGSTEYDLYLNPFQKKLQELVISPNTTIQINSELKGQFNDSDGNFTFYPVDTNKTYKSFLNSLVDVLPFNDTKSIVTSSFADLFNGKGLNKEQLIMNQQIDLVLDNLSLQTEEDDSYFKFENGESTLIQDKIVTGYKFYNMVGNEKVESTLSNNDLKSAVDKHGNFKSQFFNQVISSINSSTSQGDKESVRNGFLSKFILSFKNNLVKNFIISPQVLLIYNMVNNNNDNNLNPVNDIIKNKGLIQCLMKQVLNALLGSIFKILKRDILSLVASVSVIYIQESADKYKKILQSIIKL